MDRIEFERIALERANKEAAERAEAAAKLAEQKRQFDIREAKRIAEEEAAESKRIEESKPDVEKIRAFASVLSGLAMPSVQTEAAKLFMVQVNSLIRDAANQCAAFQVAPKKTSRKAVLA
ncbi:MAG: hypothetical protein ACRDD1_07475 [Planctomycetia bacterium]